MEAYMKAIFTNCCGLDVHKDSIVACIQRTSNVSDDNKSKEEVEVIIRKFGTIPDELKKLKSWLELENCRHIAMESTGVYWFPVYEMLEGAFNGDIELLVVNARHMKNVPGKKTDKLDAEWIADLMRCGLLRGSFIPPEAVRKLRKLTRYRKNIVGDITAQKNRVEKTLQMSGIKISSIASDVFGVSGRNLLRTLISKGKLSADDIDKDAKYLSEEKRSDIKHAVNKTLSKEDRSFLKLQLEHLDSLQHHLDSVELSITELSSQFEEAIERLDTVPGISTIAATAIIAEIGPDVDKFPTAEHFCSWAGLSPGNNESAGKKKAHV
jgi:transposase